MQNTIKHARMLIGKILSISPEHIRLNIGFSDDSAANITAMEHFFREEAPRMSLLHPADKIRLYLTAEQNMQILRISSPLSYE